MYKGAWLHLHKPHVELDKARIQSLIQNYEQLSPLITSVEASYAWFFRSLDVPVRKYDTLLIGALIEAKEKNQVRLELDAYFDQLLLTTTKANLQVSIDNMWMYIASLNLLRTKLHMLQDQLDRGSK